MMLTTGDILVIIFVVIAALGVGLYFLNRWASRKMVDQQSMLERSKQAVTIYVIDKKKMKPTEANLPKVVTDQMPKYYSWMKMPMVKAKIGPQIMTFMCDKDVFEALPLQKSVKVSVAGIYIAEMKGMKTKQELKEIAKKKKAQAKADGSEGGNDGPLGAITRFVDKIKPKK